MQPVLRQQFLSMVDFSVQTSYLITCYFNSMKCIRIRVSKLKSNVGETKKVHSAYNNIENFIEP